MSKNAYEIRLETLRMAKEMADSKYCLQQDIMYRMIDQAVEKREDIEKAILVSNLGFNPMNNGESIIISIPPLTEERRKELVKVAKSEAENAKVSIRNTRKDANNEIRKSDVSDDMKSNYEIDIQEATDKYISRIDSIFSAKEKEILSV